MRLPEKYTERMQSALGAEFGDYLAALDRPPVKGLHINTVKCDANAADGVLSLEKISGNCRRVVGGMPTRHPYYAAGLYYMQEPSAMLPVEALGELSGKRVLDLCAAPGGKSSQIAVKLAGTGLLVSNEIENSRTLILRENIIRMGYKNTVVTNMRPNVLADMFGGFFDIVVADAPCSGEGMLRKEPEAALNWSVANVKACAARQKEIVAAADKCLKEGGILLYSTCTFSEEEDEEVVRFAIGLGYETVSAPENIASLGADTGAGYKFYPHKFGGEGQFFCVLRKISEGEREARLGKPCASAASSEISEIKKTADIKGKIAKKNDLLFVPALDFDLPCLVNGVLLGRWEKGRFTPSHQMFTALGDAAREREELPLGDKRIAAYIAGEEISGSAKGWCAVSAGGYVLGGGKGSNGVIKNHYPKALRVMPR